MTDQNTIAITIRYPRTTRLADIAEDMAAIGMMLEMDANGHIQAKPTDRPLPLGIRVHPLPMLLRRQAG